MPRPWLLNILTIIVLTSMSTTAQSQDRTQDNGPKSETDATVKVQAGVAAQVARIATYRAVLIELDNDAIAVSSERTRIGGALFTQGIELPGVRYAWSSRQSFEPSIAFTLPLTDTYRMIHNAYIVFGSQYSPIRLQPPPPIHFTSLSTGLATTRSPYSAVGSLSNNAYISHLPSDPWEVVKDEFIHRFGEGILKWNGHVYGDIMGGSWNTISNNASGPFEK